MRPYGTNNCNALRYPDPYGMDVADIQAALPKSQRIRNKKQKRRVYKKRTRQTLKQALTHELSEVLSYKVKEQTRETYD